MFPNRFIQRSSFFGTLWNQLILTTPISSSFHCRNKATSLSSFCSSINVFGINNDKNNINITKKIQKQSFSSSTDNQSIKQNENKNQDDEDRKNEEEPILLMNFIPRGMPNFFNSLKNLYLINVVIRNHIDKNFQWKEFIEGAKSALILVSSHLANNRLDELDGLIEEEALIEIRKNYEKLSISQRLEFELLPTDIVLAFAHHIDIETIKEEFTGTRKHFVKFFLVFDVIRNLEEILKEKAIKQSNISPKEMFKEFADRKIICNYEFKREYIEQQDKQCKAADDWIITKLLHIKEKDIFKLKF